MREDRNGNGRTTFAAGRIRWEGDHAHAHAHASTGKLKPAFLRKPGFTVIEVIGGLWTNSAAFLSDAVHDLGDSISLGLVWYFDKLSKKGRTAQSTYGCRRYSLLGGLITGVVLITGLGFVLWNAIQGLFAPEAVNAPGMMIRTRRRNMCAGHEHQQTDEGSDHRH